MNADGALSLKLETWLKAQQFYAEAIKGHAGPWVPSVVMGQSGQSNAATALVDLLTAKTAKDIGLDLTVPVPQR